MKIEKSKPKKGVSDLPLVTKELILRLQSCSDEELVKILEDTTVWRYGKCELYHWIDVLDRFDRILEQVTKHEPLEPNSTQCIFMCPKLEDSQCKERVVVILNFTALLVEHSYARHIYNSTEHLCNLLACPDLDVILAVLNLLYVFSKRSNFISRLPAKQRTSLNSYLEYLGETWGGKTNGFGLAECCQNRKPQAFPESCTTVYFEYFPAPTKPVGKVGSSRLMSGTESVVLENVDQLSVGIPSLMAQVTATHRIPPLKQMQLLTRLQLARNFTSYQQRLKCVLARLQAISILVYSTAPAEIVDPLIYEGFVEELVEVLELKDRELVDIRAAVLRTLTAIIHLERDPRLSAIIEATGAATYHGFLPSLVRDCVTSFTSPSSSPDGVEVPLFFATALFSFLYHLATYEASGDALVSSGIMESLLEVLEWKAFEPMNITLVTRAVRVIDLITNLDMTAFHSLGGWNKMLARLDLEVSECMKESPVVLPSEVKPAPSREVPMEEGSVEEGGREVGDEVERVVPMETSGAEAQAAVLPAAEAMDTAGTQLQCIPERAALIKSILNFLKKAIPNHTFAEDIRNFVDSSLPQSLKHIVSNAEYYGPSIYLPATEVTTVFIFHEPSQLTPLQDNGLPGVVLNSVINKQIPVTREVLASLPNILSALCLNTRGLQVFVNAEPFDHLFGVLISHDYLPAMRKKKGADQIGDTASNLGVAMDELMRHQPTLRTSVIAALIRLLKKLCEMGSSVEGQRRPARAMPARAKRKPSTPAPSAGDDRLGSDSDEEEEEEEEEGDALEKEDRGQEEQAGEVEDTQRSEQGPLPLSEYVINVVHFVDAILSNNSTDDHIREFITQDGLPPLLKLFTIPALPLDFPTSTAFSAITNTCRGILNIAHAPELLTEALTQLSSLLKDLAPFLDSPDKASKSVLLAEVGPLVNLSSSVRSPVATPTLHGLVAVNAFIQLFIHLSRASQVGYNIESRALCVNHWSTPVGRSILQQLSRLYRSLVWEGFILLAVAANEDKSLKQQDSTTSSLTTSDSLSSQTQSSIPDSQGFRPPQTQSLESTDTSSSAVTTDTSTTAAESQSASSSSVPETLGTQSSELSPTPKDSSVGAAVADESMEPTALIRYLKQLTPLLTVASRLGRALAELMNLLVRISTSPLHRPHRRGPGHIFVHTYHPPSEDAIDVCQEVTNLLVDSLRWDVPTPQACPAAVQSPIGDWLFAGMTFKMYAVDFCELLLFDEHKQSYHLMLHTYNKNSVLDAFISTFHLAVRVMSQATVGGTVYCSCVEFLEAWLNLAEKMVNASSILESSHALAVPPPSQAGGKKLLFNPLFNPLAFIIQTQKAVLPCLRELWSSPQLIAISPKVVQLLILAIGHLYSSEKVIESKVADFKVLQQPTPTGSGSQAARGSSVAGPSGLVPPPPPPAPLVDPNNLQQLCDMGFERNSAEEALQACGNDLDGAMEWIFLHPPSSSVETASGGLSEDEQIMRAIAMSLGQDANAEQEREKERQREEEERERKRQEEEEKRKMEEKLLRPLDKAVLDEFSEELLMGCMELVSTVAESVYRICDLVSALAKRNGPEWRNRTLGTIKLQLWQSLNGLVAQIEADSYSLPPPGTIDPVACQIHLVALLMEEMPLASAQVVCEPTLLGVCVRLLHVAQTKLCNLGGASDTASVPRWLAPLLLLLDLWEKTVLVAKWHRPKKPGVQVVWQWFENIHGKWCTYSPENSQEMERAYQEGESSAKITSGRQRYIVQFGSMMQMNTETNTARPVLRLEIPEKGKAKSVPPGAEDSSWVMFSQEQAHTAIRCCTKLISSSVDPETLNANLRFCLRLTRQPELATVFASEGGPQALLSLTHKSSFKGFPSLASLLLRHCLEDGPLLKQSMDSVVRSVVNNPPSNKDLRTSSTGSKELHYVLGRLGPCACRNPELFTETVCSVLRMATQPPKPEQYQSLQRVPPCTLRTFGPPKVYQFSLSSPQEALINLLVDHLCAEAFLEEKSEGNGGGGAMEEDTRGAAGPTERRYLHMSTRGPVVRRGMEATQARRVRHGSYRRQLTGNYDIDDDFVSEDMNIDAELMSEPGPTAGGQPGSAETDQEARDAAATTGTEKETQRLLLSKAAVLRLLAELVESYPPCAKLVAESSRKIRIDSQPPKEMSVLAFIFDHLLPASYIQSSSTVQPVAKLSKTFLQCLACAHHSPEAISVLVAEFKMAFSRALGLPESQMKHSHVRALTGFLNQVLEAQNVYSARGIMNPSHFARLLIRKGFISDLSRAVHHLNLNSTLLPATVNSVLKPLEVLTKIVNSVALSQRRVDSLSVDSRSTLDSRPTTAVSQTSRGTETEAVTSRVQLPRSTPPATTQSSQQAPPPESVPGTSAAEGTSVRETSGGEPETVDAGASAPPSGSRQLDASVLEATHESLIPLEEEEEEEAREGSMPANFSQDTEDLIEEAVSLARELGRHRAMAPAEGGESVLQELVDELLEREPGGNGAAPGAILGEVILHSPAEHPQGAVIDSDEDSSGDSFSDDTEGEEDLDEDRCNSAGEEMEEEEFDESQGPSGVAQALGPTAGGDGDEEHADDDIGSDLSDAESSQEETEVDEEEEEEEVGDGGDDEGDTSSVASSAEGEGEEEVEVMEGGASEIGEPDVVLQEEEEEEDVTFDLEEEEDEDIEEEDELDLEYGYDDEEDDPSGYVHVDIPWGLRGEPVVDILHPHGFGSIFSRTFRSRPQLSELDQQASAAVHTLPQSHPLLTGLADASLQQEVSRGGTGPGGVSGGPEGLGNQLETNSVLQQLLTNISAAMGASELLSFAVGSSAGGQRGRVLTSSQAQTTDDGSESTVVPSAQLRWEEESQALDGPVSHLCIASVRDTITERLTEIFEEENKPKVTVSAPSPSDARVPTSRGGDRAPQQVPVVPHPSDQATPASPRDSSETVDQLRSSLRQVADALAQTVAAVRSTREQLLVERSGAELPPLPSGSREGEGGENQPARREDEEPTQTQGSREEVRMETSEVPLPPRSPDSSAALQRPLPELISYQLSSPPSAAATRTPLSTGSPSTSAHTAPPISTTSTLTASTTSVPILATFDGSQESARATLATTNPEDPLYTFLSAVAGAPAPPLPETSASLSPPSDSLPRSLSSPRLPVFAQFQSASTRTATSSEEISESSQPQPQSQDPTSQSPSLGTSIPMSVIQDTRDLVPPPPPSAVSVSTAVTSMQQRLSEAQPTPPTSTTVAASGGSETISSVGVRTHSIASQVSNFFGPLSDPLPTTTPSPQSSAGASATAPPPVTVSADSLFTTSLAQAELAQELARAVIELMPTTSASPTTTTSTTASTSQLELTAHPTVPVPTLSAPSVIVPAAVSSSGQSPSPSDTLAPLISSLQMPTVGGSSQAEASPPTQPTTEERADHQQATPSDMEVTESHLEVEGRGDPLLGLATEATSERTTGESSSELSVERRRDMLTPTGELQRTGETGEATAGQTGSTAQTGGLSASGGAEGGATASARDASGEGHVADEIDPTFLAALPDSIRQEVLAQHERERRLRVRQQENVQSSISPEFLAALPSSIQEEVLQQERIERAARQDSDGSHQAQPMDNASFFHNLNPELRRAILADVDDSTLSHLPEELASEARALRQERENRRRQMYEQRHAFLERMIEQAEHGGVGGPRVPIHSWEQNMDPAGYRYAVLNLNPQHILDGHHHYHSGGPGLRYGALRGDSSLARAQDLNSKQMLDQEALSCLLVLLFLDQSRLHNNRLHRIIKNLSQHRPTRSWILSSLLAIIQGSSSVHFPHRRSSPRIVSACPMPPPLTPRSQGSSSIAASSEATALVTSTPISPHVCTPHWLNVTVNAALGSHAHIFQFEHSGKVGTSARIHVHPSAGAAVCNNVLDLLVFISKSFPSSLLPSELLPKGERDRALGGESTTTPTTEDRAEGHTVISNFWQILLRLDGASSRKGKGALKNFQYSEPSQSRSECEIFSASILGQLMMQLQCNVIKDSLSLTDKLLRVMSLASSQIPKAGLVKRKTGEAAPGKATQLPEAKGKTSGPKAVLAARDDHEEVFAVHVEPQSIVEPLLLKIVIEVLTSGRCSEDGLDDATLLLTNLSRCSMSTRETILTMLLDGVRTIGLTLCSQISILLHDLSAKMEALKRRRKSTDPPAISASLLLGQYSELDEPQRTVSEPIPGPSGVNVIPGVVLPSLARDNQPTDHSHDLHLPSMVPLTCKGSQQSFFLRMLKVVCQLRDSAEAALQAQSRAAAANQASSSLPLVPDTVPPLPPAAPDNPLGDHPMDEGQQPDLAPQPPTDASTASQTTSTSPKGETPATNDVDRSDDDQHIKSFMLQPLSLQLELEELWTTLSDCLGALDDTKDPHAVLVLQPTVEAFFLVHADRSEEAKGLARRQRAHRGRAGRLSSFHTISDTESNPASPAPHLDLSPMPGTPGPSEADLDPYAHLPPDTARFLKFAEQHRTVLNQILRQTTVPLSDGPFAVLVNHVRVLDFDIKRRYFRQELEQIDDGLRRDDVILHLRRDHIFEDSFRELYRRSPEDLKGSLYIQFEGEEGQDAGGLLREWYLIIAREMFNPNYALFRTTPGDRVTYMPNPSSSVNPNHLNYFKFIGRVIAKAIYDNKLLDCYFTRSFYKHILGKPVHYTDMEAEDYLFYQGLVYLLEHDANEIGADLTFSVDVQEFGKMETKDLKPNGNQVPVTEANKREYVQLACQMKMTNAIRAQIKSFLEGFYEIIPKELIAIFNEQELELLISGLPNIDIDDLKAHTEYRKYTDSSLQIQWFWRALRSFDQADRARFLQFVTGTSKVPLQGFAALEGMNGIQKFQIHKDERSTDRLPCAHTCFNQLDLPVYETYDKLRTQLLTAIRECPEGFGLA